MTEHRRPEWQYRQQHENDVRNALAGVELDSKGRLRQWFGKQSLAKLAAKGHSAVGFEQCECHK